MIMKEAYYQDLAEAYERHGEEILLRFREELRQLKESRKNFFVERGQPRSRWTESDGEREGVLESFISNIDKEKERIFIEEESRKKSSKIATDFKYAAGRDLYKEAIEIAEQLWMSGDRRNHIKMLTHIAGKAGGSPGTDKKYHHLGKFDENCGYTRNGLRKRLKELAYTIDPSLVAGINK